MKKTQLKINRNRVSKRLPHIAGVCLVIMVLVAVGMHVLNRSGEAAGSISLAGTLNGAGGGGVAVDDDGNVYIASGSLIKKYNSADVFLTSWASSATKITTDPDGNVFGMRVTNGDSIVYKYDANGNLLTSWGSAGSGNGQFGIYIGGLATDSLGNVYVSDITNARVQKFDNSGNYLTQWGSAGSGNGEFCVTGNGMGGLAVSPDDVVYVLERCGAHRVQLFNATGTYLSSWNATFALNAEEITVNDLGYVYVKDSFNILKYTEDGSFIQGTGITFGAGPQLYAISAAPNGHIYAGPTTSGGYDVRYYEDTLILSIDTESLPSTTVGYFYSDSIETSAAEGEISFSISAGSLPDGLSINSTTGEISGQSTSAGVYEFTVQAVDNVTTATRSLEISVVPEEELAIITDSLPGGETGVAYSQTVTTENQTDPTSFSISAGSLPDGLSINSTTGEISGIPTTAGEYDFTVEVEDVFFTATQAYTVEILAVSNVTITTTTLNDGVVGAAYSDTVESEGALADVTYALASGTLPTGLSLNTSSGVISGTPTVEVVSSFEISATDGDTSDTQAYDLTVGPAADDSDEEEEEESSGGTGGSGSDSGSGSESINEGVDTEASPDVATTPALTEAQQKAEAKTKAEAEDEVQAAVQIDRIAQKSPQLATLVSAIAKRLGVSPATLVTGIPWTLVLLMGLVSALAAYQALGQFKLSKRARKRLTFTKRLIDEKNSFVMLASHYLRTPEAVIQGGVELAQKASGNALNGLAIASQSLGITINKTLQQVEAQTNTLPQDSLVNENKKQARLMRPGFIIPVIIFVAALGSSYGLVAYLGFSIAAQVIAAQVVGITILAGFFAMAYMKKAQRKLEIEQLNSLIDKQYEVDKSRNHFIASIGAQLKPGVSNMRSTIPADLDAQPKKLIEAGLEEMEHTIKTFDLLSSLEHKASGTASGMVRVTDVIRQAEQEIPGLSGRLKDDIDESVVMRQSQNVLNQVLVSILANSVEHSGPNSTVKVEYHDNKERKEIVIEDNGRGIPKEKFSSLFKPLTRVEDSNEYSHLGRGMSLFVSRMIMRYIGGDLRAESELGKGTKMHIILPKA